DTESQGSYWDELYGSQDFEDFADSHLFGAGVVPHAFEDPRIDQDVVHEPFLNFAYPAANRPSDPITTDYDFEATTQRTLGGDRDQNGVTDVMTSLHD